MKPTVFALYLASIMAGIFCAMLIYTRNTIWFYVPAAIILCFWLVANRKHLRFYLHPKSTQVNQNGIKCLRLGQFEKAVQFFDYAIKLYPRNALAYSNRGLANANMGNPERAIADADEAIRLMPQLEHAYSTKAFAPIQKHNYDQAILEAEYSIRINQKFAFAYQMRGVAHFGKRQFADAIDDYHIAIELSQHSKKKRFRASLYSDLSAVYWLLKNSNQSIATVNKAIAIDSKYAIALNNRGYFQACLGNLEPALDDCNKAISLQPRLYLAYGSRGHVCFLKQQYEDALVDFQKSLEISPNNEFRLVGQALCLEALGQTPTTIKQLKKLIELNPKYNDTDYLVDEYNPATQFVDAFHRLLVSFNATINRDNQT